IHGSQTADSVASDRQDARCRPKAIPEPHAQHVDLTSFQLNSKPSGRSWERSDSAEGENSPRGRSEIRKALVGNSLGPCSLWASGDWLHRYQKSRAFYQEILGQHL